MNGRAFLMKNVYPARRRAIFTLFRCSLFFYVWPRSMKAGPFPSRSCSWFRSAFNGVILATFIRGLSNDVFFQVGLLTTVGLAAKNAILIVEFAKENVDRGMNLIEGTVHAAQQRLRPILMTSLAFMLGVMPLALSSGAGAGGRVAIGTGVIGGMLTATILGIFFVPIFFVVVRGYTERKQKPQKKQGSLHHEKRKRLPSPRRKPGPSPLAWTGPGLSSV